MPTRRKSGFTLIELLVVIAIIAILAAILFPVFARAREQARKATCTNNLKSCGTALQLYKDEYQGTMPSSAIVDPEGAAAGDNNNAENYIAFGATAGALPPPTADDNYRPTTWPQALFDHLKSSEIVFCPSDGSGKPYIWKYAIDKAWNDPNIRARRESDFAYNAEQIVLFEGGGFHFGEAGELDDTTQINVLYLDTHVRTVSLSDANPAATEDNITDEILQSNFEPFVFNYNNKENTEELGVNPRVYSDRF